ncbi:MAG: MBL fold metallo-hydrolase [Leptospiraceae bacterium]|nr:MBL fold metallo-hydrolase [Leptospiraceae bacterium]
MKKKEIAIIVFYLIGVYFFIDCKSGKERKDLKPHYTENGFKNPSSKFIRHGFGAMVKWRWNRDELIQSSTDPKNYQFAQIKNDGKILRENNSNFSATWIGHATVLVQIEGKNILTDPIWSDRCSPVKFAGPKRYTKPGVALDDLPKIDLVIISHNHYDHLDTETLIALEKKFQPLFLAGLGNEKFLKNLGLSKVKELDWWDEVQEKEMKITFTPTQHFSGRKITDLDKTLWGSYVVSGIKKKFYFSGDTGYFEGFKEIGEKFPDLDLAILPIGAYEPRWFMSPMHVDPHQSVQAFLDLKAKYMIPMHYLTFVLTDEALDEPLRLAYSEFENRNISLEKLLGLKIGESFFFDE